MESQATAASKFLKFLFSLKNSLISWEDSLVCNAERKVILPAEACFVYNVLERLLLFSALLRTAQAAAARVPVGTGVGRFTLTLVVNSKMFKHCIG